MTVDVWVAPLDVPPEVLGPLVAALAPGERARAGRYRDADAARRFCVARGWVRHVLGLATATAATDVRLVEGPGKPRLEGGAGIRFNLSHSGELALIAVADREVGVDVESVAGGAAALDAVPLACSPAEAAALAALPPDERADAFLCLWTAKEAYLKATGVGLATAPGSVEVGLPDATGAMPVHEVGQPAGGGWCVRRVRPADGYVAAVAAAGAAWDVTLRDTAAIAPTSSVEGRMASRSGRS